MIWFTSDLHFGHTNIIEYCKRPFPDVSTMNEQLVRNWNSLVKPQDTVYIIGDCHCGRGSASVAVTALAQCNGQKHLIRGNHDTNEFIELAAEAELFESVQDYLEVKWNNTKFVLFHFPMRAWHKSHQGSIHLYGHSHGNMPGIGRSMDVGVDPNNYRPISIEDVYNKLSPITEMVEHHDWPKTGK